MAAPAAPVRLTNVDVVEMVRGGASAEAIRAKVCASEPSFLLQNANLLTTMGVPATVLDAMELRQRTGSCEPRPVASYTPPPAAVQADTAKAAELKAPVKKRRVLMPWTSKRASGK